MKIKIWMSLIGLLVLMGSCADSELDPLRFDDITKGSIITLRGAAVDNLNNRDFLGAVDSFSVSGNNPDVNFEFESDFLSDDISSLQEVRVYALAEQGGARSQVATKAGSEFSVPSGEKYPRSSFSIPLSTILTAIGKDLADFSPGNYIFIECDITLTDGTEVPASAVVNSSLFESSLFYPAHNLRYIAGE
ncbi:MAG TPA: hypothetical protein PKA00_02690 [Saprospiraceae bacterium]|nr:hypothetical protein [Saprospiraceae bacterium]HMQ81781.1 hypothetical protein [Saprospiraceae bacterium]